MTRYTKDQTLSGRLRQIFLFSWRDCAVCVGILAAAALLCALLRMIDSSDVYVALIFECAVVLVSRFTDGYLFGLACFGDRRRRRELDLYIPLYAAQFYHFRLSADLPCHAGRLRRGRHADHPRSSSRKSSVRKRKEKKCAAISCGPSLMISVRP